MTHFSVQPTIVPLVWRWRVRLGGPRRIEGHALGKAAAKRAARRAIRRLRQARHRPLNLGDPTEPPYQAA